MVGEEAVSKEQPSLFSQIIVHHKPKPTSIAKEALHRANQPEKLHDSFTILFVRDGLLCPFEFAKK